MLGFQERETVQKVDFLSTQVVNIQLEAPKFLKMNKYKEYYFLFHGMFQPETLHCYL